MGVGHGPPFTGAQIFGDSNLVACKNVVKNQGFVLHPGGSWAF